MKSINIPAQITTVEDRIAGNLSLTQLGLLAAPVFIDFVLYVILPKPMHLYLYKLVFMAIISSVFALLAVRIKGKLMLFWLKTIISFRIRNKVFIFNKNSLYLRDTSKLMETSVSHSDLVEKTKSVNRAPLNTVNNVIDIKDLKLDLCFIEEKKGRLYVYVSEG